jgi:Flp pilus assembly protein TadG
MKMRTRQAERGMAVVAATVMLVLLIPVTGLAIDVTLLYVDKARLQGAADGAALAGAESLARGTTDAAQQLAAQQAAAEYVFLNYPSSFFFTNTVTVCYTCNPSDVQINETVANQRTVIVYAHANVPTLFMRWLKFTSTNVNASATVTRRDVNIVLVVDRSGSLSCATGSCSCPAVIQAATNFVNKFANGSDNVGLVTFASSTSDDFPIANNFLGASGTLPAPSQTVPTILGNITCAGSTSSPMALWYAYDQLVGLNQPNALNVILFFTDGTPTGVNVNMPLLSASGCSAAHASGTVFTSYRNINGLYNTYTGGDTFFGVLAPGNTTGSVPPDDTNAVVTTDGSNAHGCAFNSNWSSSETTYSDFVGVPEFDVYGDNLNSGYQTIGTEVACAIPSLSTNKCFAIGSGTTVSASAMAQNGTDRAGYSIRTGATEQGPLTNAGKGLSSVVIYSIGLGNALTGTLNQDLLARVANSASSSSYVAPPTQQQGDFILAPTSADINAAFATIAAEILRIAK